MKSKILYISLLFCFCLSSCMIDDDCLDPEIREKFEEARGGSNNGGKEEKSENECEVNILSSCVFTSECSFEISLKKSAKGYKWFFSDEAFTESEVYAAARRLSYIEGKEINYITGGITPTGKKKFLYVVAYESPKKYGSYAVATFYTCYGDQFCERPRIIDLKRQGDVISWTFQTYQYYCSYVILTGKDAEYGRNLPESAFALYMKRFDQYTQNPDIKIIKKEFTVDGSPVLIGARLKTSGGDQSLAIAKEYIN